MWHRLGGPGGYKSARLLPEVRLYPAQNPNHAVGRCRGNRAGHFAGEGERSLAPVKAQAAPGDGSDERRSKVDYVHKEREIDRDNDRYRERVVDEEGVVLHDVEEPLSLHFGHGSAKVRKPNPGTP